MYFILALCLFSSAESAAPPGYRAVLRTLTEKLRHLPGWAVQHLPSSSALTRARQRLGTKPLQILFESRCGHLATAASGGSFAFGLRLTAWDGTALDVPNTPENSRAFGHTGRTGVNLSWNPQLRLMALIECGTHAIIDAAFDAVDTFSEHKLARRLLASLQEDTLLLADRNFAGHELWGLARATGAHLAWRIKKNLVFVPLRVLPDGSYLTIMRTPQDNLRYGHARADGRTLPGRPDGHLVRIIDYTVTVRSVHAAPRTETFRLVTSLLDHRQAPARQLAQIYHERWEIENSYAELKNRLRGVGFVLRSKSPDLVRQETYALLTVYQAICALETHTAERAGIDPDRLSFTVSVQLARLTIAHQDGLNAAALNTCRREVTAELLANLLPTRRDRRCHRVKKPIKNTFEVKKRGPERTSGPVRYTVRVTKHSS
jgi:hypothetical protein